MSIKVETFENCTSHLKNNGLVAFPTETVYGLGANAFDENAVLKIFRSKERPSTDPLIVHVDKLSRILEWNIVDISEDNYKIIKLFDIEFYPGPLTMILPCTTKLPSVVTSNTGFVGIRVPNNLNALNLIKKCQVPIAAPSANKFGHISPTRKEHVLEDFKDCQENIYVLDNSDLPNIGIESTIIKFDFEKKQINILRPGYITKDKLENFLKSKNLNFKVIEDIKYKKIGDILNSSGELITHYAPNCNTILIETSRYVTINDLPIKTNFAVIDYNNLCKSLKLNKNLEYYDLLSAEGNIEKAAFNYYNKLRNFELICNKKNQINVLYLVKDNKVKNNFYNSLIDRMIRSSSGNIVSLY